MITATWKHRGGSTVTLTRFDSGGYGISAAGSGRGHLGRFGRGSNRHRPRADRRGLVLPRRLDYPLRTAGLAARQRASVNH